MDNTNLFTAALQLEYPWKVSKVEFIPEEAEPRLKKLCSWLMRSRLQPMKELCGMIRDHWTEILNYTELFRVPPYKCHSGEYKQHHTKHQAKGTRL